MLFDGRGISRTVAQVTALIFGLLLAIDAARVIPTLLNGAGGDHATTTNSSTSCTCSSSKYVARASHSAR
jgi:hypothetical protein